MRVLPTTPWISYCSAARPPTCRCRGAEICLERRPLVRVSTPSWAKRPRLVARSALLSVTTIRYWCRALLPSWMSASSFSAIFDQLLGTAIRLVRSVAVTHFVLALGWTAWRCAVVGTVRLVLGVHSGLNTIWTSADRPISPATTPIQAGTRRRRCRCRRDAEGGGGGGGGHVAMGILPDVRGGCVAPSHQSPLPGRAKGCGRDSCRSGP